MRLALDCRREVTDQLLAFGRQMGATDVIIGGGVVPAPRGYFEFRDLVLLRTQIEDAGLRLAAIENIPYQCYDQVLLGLPGRDQQIENWCRSLRNMGRAGIPILGYNFMALGVWRTSHTTPTRGAARATAFDYKLVKEAPVTEAGEISDQQMWDNFTYFLKAVIPVAEQAEVRMGLHPDDPPISPIAGIARIFRSHAALKRLVELVPSDYNALEFCQGTISEMPEEVIEAIRYFGSRKKILYVHFRNVTRPVPAFAESFIGEGHVNMLKAMQAYQEVGFDGPMIEDHVPVVSGDTPYGHMSRAYAMGYIQALMDAVKAP